MQKEKKMLKRSIHAKSAVLELQTGLSDPGLSFLNWKIQMAQLAQKHFKMLLITVVFQKTLKCLHKLGSPFKN